MRSLNVNVARLTLHSAPRSSRPMKLTWIAFAVVGLVACGDDSTSGGGGSGGNVTGGGGAGGESTGGGGAGGNATGGAGGNTSGGGGAGGNANDLSECQNNGDCPDGGTCIELIAGYRVCQQPIEPATKCSTKFDSCCDTSDCDTGTCLHGPLVPLCAGVKLKPTNACGSDLCASDADCGPSGICAPAGTFGNLVRACLDNQCDGSCNCGLVEEPCCQNAIGLLCVVDCQSNSDCGPDKFCEAGTCQDGFPLCPL